MVRVWSFQRDFSRARSSVADKAIPFQRKARWPPQVGRYKKKRRRSQDRLRRQASGKDIEARNLWPRAQVASDSLLAGSPSHVFCLQRFAGAPIRNRRLKLSDRTVAEIVWHAAAHTRGRG